MVGFEWDENKRALNRATHDVDLLHAARMFRNPVVEKKDERRDYGEERFIAIGMVDDECFVLVWTPRGEKRRLISAWKGGRDERQQYQDGIARRH